MSTNIVILSAFLLEHVYLVDYCIENRNSANKSNQQYLFFRSRVINFPNKVPLAAAVFASICSMYLM